MSYDFENIIIGAGVIGLAIARELSIQGQDVLVLEKNGHFGEETSSRNSEVIHAGIYYPKGSLKAKFCVEGKELLYKYCEDFNIPRKKVGKLIVATTREELGILSDIEEKAQNNNVMDLQRLTKDQALQMEPLLFCEGALLSPSTGIIDTHQYMLSLVGEVGENNGSIAYHSPFTSALKTNHGFLVTSGTTTLSCKNLINSAGLAAQNVAKTISELDSRHIPKQDLVKGSYFTAHHPSPFKKLIYPVPNTVSLGIHVTLDLAGQIRFGPDQEWVSSINYDVNVDRAEDFYAAIRRYYPTLPENCLIAAYSGIRPKIKSPSGSPADFHISGPAQHKIDGLINLFGMESPGLTSSLRIGQHVAEILEK